MQKFNDSCGKKERERGREGIGIEREREGRVERKEKKRGERIGRIGRIREGYRKRE